MRTRGGIVFLMVVLGLAGCSGSSPSAPGPGSQPLPSAFFIRGTVSDTAFRPLAGARVEVVDGPQAGLATTADAKGEFSLIRRLQRRLSIPRQQGGARRTGNPALDTSPSCSPDNRWVSLSLHVLASAISMAGDYALTFVADDACTMLPQEARTQTSRRRFRSTANAIPAPTRHQPSWSAVPNFFEGWKAWDLASPAAPVAFWLETLVEQPARTPSSRLAGWPRPLSPQTRPPSPCDSPAH